MNRINKNLVERIRVIDKQQNNRIYWLDSKRSWIFGETRKAGFYSILDWSESHPYTAQDLKDGIYNETPFIVINKSVYFRPYVEIVLSSGQKRIRTFWTYKECCNYARDFADKNDLDNAW